MRKGGQVHVSERWHDQRMSTTTDTFARFVDVLADSLDVHEAAGDTLASRVHLPWFHFDRLVSAAAGEPPATFRRRFLLERASPTTRSMRAPSSPSTGSTSTRPCARCSHASSGSSRCGTPSLTTERTTSTSNGTRARLDETFVNALCDPPEVFTYGGMIAHG